MVEQVQPRPLAAVRGLARPGERLGPVIIERLNIVWLVLRAHMRQLKSGAPPGAAAPLGRTGRSMATGTRTQLRSARTCTRYSNRPSLTPLPGEAER